MAALSLFRTGLIKIELRGGPVVRVCDGGLIKWPATSETFTGSDALFGTVAAIERISSSVGESVPDLRINWMPPADVLPSALRVPGYQGSPLTIWIGAYDPATSAIVGTPKVEFAGMIDTLVTESEEGSRTLIMTAVATAERLFAINDGNSLNPKAHKRVWPSELGEDNAIDMGTTVAWGTLAPTGNSGAVTFGGGVGGAQIERAIREQ